MQFNPVKLHIHICLISITSTTLLVIVGNFLRGQAQSTKMPWRYIRIHASVVRAIWGMRCIIVIIIIIIIILYAIYILNNEIY